MTDATASAKPTVALWLPGVKIRSPVIATVLASQASFRITYELRVEIYE